MLKFFWPGNQGPGGTDVCCNRLKQADGNVMRNRGVNTAARRIDEPGIGQCRRRIRHTGEGREEDVNVDRLRPGRERTK